MADLTLRTPGPWWYQEGADAYTHIVRAGENLYLCQFAQDPSGRAEANARLTAASPELLDALRLCVAAIQRQVAHPYEHKVAGLIDAAQAGHAAIAKALGWDAAQSGSAPEA